MADPTAGETLEPVVVETVDTVEIVETVVVDAEGPDVPEELQELDDDELQELDDDELEELRALEDRLLLEATGAPGLAVRLGAEALGTFALVLVIVGVMLYLPLSAASVPAVGTMAIALAGGLVLAGVTAGLGRVSGGHFNPAVTLASTIAGRTAWADLLLYWIAQVLGAIAAVAVVFLTVPQALLDLLGDGTGTSLRSFMSSTANGWDEGSPLWALSGGRVGFDLKAALIIELVGAALLAAVVLGASHRRSAGRYTTPVAIGLTYAALLLLTVPITGGSLNPARSTGAAVFAESAALGQLWLFWVAPLAGAAIAALVYRAVAMPPPDDLDLDDEDEDEDEELLVVRR